MISAPERVSFCDQKWADDDVAEMWINCSRAGIVLSVKLV